MLDSFTSLVRPVLAEGVSRTVTNLTGIATCDVHAEGVEELPQVLKRLEEWVGKAPARIVAWSHSDKDQVKAECAYKGIETSLLQSRWLDLQKVYPRVMRVGKPGKAMALRVAADWYGVAIDAESAHRALYDAQVTAELMRQLLTGEWREQIRALEATMAAPEKVSQPLTNNLGSACGELAALLAVMTGQQTACAA